MLVGIFDGDDISLVLYFIQESKKPSHCCNRSLLFEPVNVMVPTAVESHIAHGILSLVGARLRAVLCRY